MARDAGKLADSAERDAVEVFAFQHRLSIARAFHRKLKRIDVVAAIAELYERHKENVSAV